MPPPRPKPPPGVNIPGVPPRSVADPRQDRPNRLQTPSVFSRVDPHPAPPRAVNPGFLPLPPSNKMASRPPGTTPNPEDHPHPPDMHGRMILPRPGRPPPADPPPPPPPRPSATPHQGAARLPVALLGLVKGLPRGHIPRRHIGTLPRAKDLPPLPLHQRRAQNHIPLHDGRHPHTLENPQPSPLHIPCGTGIILLVIVMAIFIFAPLALPACWVVVHPPVNPVHLVAALSLGLVELTSLARGRPWVRLTNYPALPLAKEANHAPERERLVLPLQDLPAIRALERPPPASADERGGVEVAA